MNKPVEPEESEITKIIEGVAEGINDAEPIFPNQDDLKKENNGKQAIRYLLWGLISVVVNFGAFFIFYKVLKINYQISNLIAWFLGVQVGFWVDRVIVFRHKSNTAWREMLAFYGTRIFTFLVETATLWIGISLLSANGAATKIVGQILAIVGNYVFSKFFIFKNHQTA